MSTLQEKRTRTWSSRSMVLDLETPHGAVVGYVEFDAEISRWRWGARAPSRNFDFGQRGVEDTRRHALEAAEAGATEIARALAAEDGVEVAA